MFKIHRFGITGQGSGTLWLCDRESVLDTIRCARRSYKEDYMCDKIPKVFQQSELRYKEIALTIRSIILIGGGAGRQSDLREIQTFSGILPACDVSCISTPQKQVAINTPQI